jgi:peptidoglycan/xylan/chitin deacetylase (PgdA/CDA1 family)
MKKPVTLFLLAFFLFAITTFAQVTKSICITIDDLPANSTQPNIERFEFITTQLLKTLKEYKVPAIGFVNEIKLNGEGAGQVERYRALLRAWVDQGMELGNHTYSHMDYNQNSVEAFEKDIIKGETVTNQLFASDHNRVKYFRHPYLHSGNTKQKQDDLRNLLKKLNYTEAPVTIDNSEWIFARGYDIALDKKDSIMAMRIGNEYIQYMMQKVSYYEKQSEKLFNRNIAQVLLIHANSLNANYLALLLKALKANGYQFETLTETLKDTAYTSLSEYVGNGGISWIDRWAITQRKPKDFFAGEPRTPDYILKYAGLDSE